ncbi:glycoside hydrolase family 13 protein [Plicaturopsis crispa FD-325 SS-3]|uniref:Glycoside hydrolase family 13 protein n=1 Tax=Plicaturopsis crispa FD-325 SS-3 TaxID=944288 RepID=A0A0C9SYE5_PLICR|nr:glycoside hydrolase family 13 protein [Plicaturopsis crispa FD-325 SS-3]
MGFISWIKSRIYEPWHAPALPRMRLGPEGSPNNPLMIQFFTWDCLRSDMSWWRHLECEIPRLATLGVTQIWLPPAHKAMVPDGRGYDAYDLWDLGEFEQKGSIATRWGTREELLGACATAQSHSIDVLIDAVLNHKLGADRPESFLAVPVDPDNRLQDIGPAQEVEGWTAFDFPGRSNKYSRFQWNHTHFTGIDWDQRTRRKGVFRIATESHKGWSQGVDNELGNYDYLLGADIDHRHPDVRDDLLSWGTWVTNAEGFRFDAIKHMDREFLLEFITTVRQRSGKTDMFSVSEYWSGNLKIIMPCIKALQGQTAFFDVPLHYNFHRASKEGSDFDLRTILDGTIVKARPGDAVTFVDNHDTVVGQSLESWVGPNFKTQAYALILLRTAGHPCVFYGDTHPYTEGYDEETARNVALLMQARKLFAYGPMKDYFHYRNCVGFVRAGDSDHRGCVVIISNGTSDGKHAIRMYVGKQHGNATFHNFLSSRQTILVGADGWYNFICPPQGVQVWVRT